MHGPSTRLAVIAIATSVPPDMESQWSHALIASELRKRGLEISPATIGRILADAHVRPHKVRGWLNRADDPGFWARAGQVCRLYLDPPPGTVLISIDEKTGIQAKTRIRPDIPGRPGRDARREFEYKRHGTVSIIAAMNVATGEIIASRIRRNDSVTFMSFPADARPVDGPGPAHPPDHGQRLQPHLEGHPGLDHRAPEIQRDLYAEARVLAEHDLR